MYYIRMYNVLLNNNNYLHYKANVIICEEGKNDNVLRMK